MKYLIINGDDFGLCSSVNKGIQEAAEKGILTSTTLMANMDVQDAWNHYSDLPVYSVGIHLNLTVGKPLTAGKTIAENGCFYSFKEFMHRFLSQKISSEDIYDEFKAQMENALNIGFPLSHIDSHKHIHALPGISAIAARIAGEFGIHAMREFRKDSRQYFLTQGYDIQKIKVDRISGIKCPEFFAGLKTVGRLTGSKVKEVIQNLKDGVTELMTHPGYESDELNRLSSLTTGRQIDLSGLTAAGVRDFLNEKKVKLISFSDFSGMKSVD